MRAIALPLLLVLLFGCSRSATPVDSAAASAATAPTPSPPPVDAVREPTPRPSPELCKVESETARMLMEARQRGAAMSKAMETVEAGDELHRKMIIAAWDSPRYSTQEHQRRAIEDFENDVYLQCVKAGS